jgi:preprotein translocase subunit SecY
VLQTIRNAWKIADLRKKLIFTFVILLLYRIGNVIPVPFVDLKVLRDVFEQQAELSSGILGLFNMMSGSAFSRATLFALSIQPYINASIIIQLLTIAIPALERLSKEGGEEGRKKIERITRYTTLGIGLLQGTGYYMLLRANSLLSTTQVWPAIVIVLAFTAGSVFVMWLGEQITEFGIGNGISMLLFAGIVSRFPNAVYYMYVGMKNYLSGNAESSGFSVAPWAIPLILIGMLALMVFVVFINAAERRIPVQYAKRVVGRKQYGGQASKIPMKVNMSGVLPIIFAQTIATIPATIAAFVPSMQNSAFMKTFDANGPVYAVVYVLLIIGFSYFYATIQFNPIEVANNLKAQGGFVPGFRPGRPTAEFLSRVLNRVTMFGAIYLGIIALLPIITGNLIGMRALSIGGTSVLIVVSVALETQQAMEAQMVMRTYKGFLN